MTFGKFERNGNGAVARHGKHDAFFSQAGVHQGQLRNITLGDETAIGSHDHPETIIEQAHRCELRLFERNCLHGFDGVNKQTGNFQSTHKQNTLQPNRAG